MSPQRMYYPLEHSFQRRNIHVLCRQAGSFVVLVTNDRIPVYLVARIMADPVPEHALRPAVSFAEGVDVVDLVVEVCQAFSKFTGR